MASDTYYKDMWLRRNRTALQVVIVLMGIILVVLLFQNVHRSPATDSKVYMNGAGSDDTPPHGPGHPGKSRHFRGKVLKDDDDFHIDLEEIDGNNPNRNSDCCTIFDLWQTNNYDFECFPIDEIPLDRKPEICPYLDQEGNAKNVDVNQQTISLILKHLEEGGESFGFIDISSHLGEYSLSAASAGSSVLAVEGDLDDVIRFHKAVKLGRHESRITLLNNVVSDAQGYVTLRDNQPEVKKIIMDDLPAFCKFRKAVMKVSLNGNEHKAFKHAKFLFKELQITHVFLDWVNIKGLSGRQDTDVVNDMITYFNRRGYVPRSYSGKVLSIRKWTSWPDQVFWHRM